MLISNAIQALQLLSPICALIYGFGFSHRPPSPLRTAIKALAVASLATFALQFSLLDLGYYGPSPTVWGGLILAGGFALCAIGDAFLAGDPKRWLAPGLVAFLLGHVFFIALFLQAVAMSGRPPLGPWYGFAVAAVIGTGGGLLRWLWPDLGGLRWPVVAYVVVIVTMVCTGLIEATERPLWAVGGLLFMASDAILAVQLFKSRELLVSKLLNGWAIWFLYYAAQVCFLIGSR